MRERVSCRTILLLLLRGRADELLARQLTVAVPVKILEPGLNVLLPLISAETIQVELSDVDRAILDGEDEGFLKVLVKKGSDQILGATLVAQHAGEMISQVTLAMTNGVGLRGFAKTIYPYPTQAEAIRKAGDAYDMRRLTPLVKKLLTKFLGWRR